MFFYTTVLDNSVASNFLLRKCIFIIRPESLAQGFNLFLSSLNYALATYLPGSIILPILGHVVFPKNNYLATELIKYLH